tara:strand:- start:347 stop:553 length:207 start_codon:yes stop_codon:yes gene_type:complete
MVKTLAKPQIKSIQCKKCNGAGLIKREREFKCLNCIKTSNKYGKCFLCENKKHKKYYECNNCYGSGVI